MRDSQGHCLPVSFRHSTTGRQFYSCWILYWTLSARYRVLLAPAGSKMQAIGCYIVKALHPDIHVEYPSPDGLSRDYSSGFGDRWVLDFGNLWQLLSELEKAERRECLEISIPPLRTS